MVGEGVSVVGEGVGVVGEGVNVIEECGCGRRRIWVW